MKNRFHIIPTIKQQGITSTQIAAKAGCSQANVSQFIHGQHSSQRVAQAISDLAGVPIETLISKEKAA